MRIIDTSRLYVVAAAALAITSCTRESGGPAASSDNAGVTSAGATPAAAPSSTAAKAPTALPVPSAGAQAAPAPGVEAAAAPPSPQVLQAVSAAQAKLDGLTAGVAGTRVRFVDCSETASCTARVEAQSLAGLRDLLQSVSGQGGIGFVAREQLDAYSGRTFVADVALGAAIPRAVPTDENALLDD
ncbi:MAG TPA: hypothetical protein VK989_03435 [Polyangia bacterium]|jgi:hypothetical protein|nr:hypothetical protein [Polyangia bacterium]